MKNLKNGKAAGIDGIPYELCKYGGKKVIAMLWSMFGKYGAKKKCHKSGMKVEQFCCIREDIRVRKN